MKNSKLLFLVGCLFSLSFSITPFVQEVCAAIDPLICDNGEPCTSFTGSWPVSGGECPYGDNSIYSRDWMTHTWSPELPQTGKYEVYMWWTYFESRCDTCPVTISCGAETIDTIHVNQLDEDLACQWNLLGTYDFEAGTECRVTITAEGVPSQVPGKIASTCADAVKFEYVAVCDHDGNIDTGEECDGTNLGGLTCQDLGYDGGVLSCNDQCRFDESGCYLCSLNPRFEQTTLTVGMNYYTDRNYTLTNVPSQYVAMDMIKTPNDDLACTDASDYLTFQIPCDGTVYVAFDRRASVLPNWMSGFGDTFDDISTSLSTQGYLNVFSKTYTTGECINFGCNHAPGSSDEYRSNYIVLYGCGSSPVCGDGTVEGLEQCDDGNTNPGDGCDENCIAEVCGNGVLQSGEECDDGNTNPGDGCDENCIAEVCGDGVLQSGEECDDGNTNPGDGCDENCIAEVCGNGVLQSGEECDDGNTNPGDGCDENCIAEVCGDGVLQSGEECDDGNTNPGDGCDQNCIAEVCGNGVLQSGEECDGIDDDACPGLCQADCTCGVPACTLDPRFEQTTLTVGMNYYTDRNYTLTNVPSQYVGMDMIKTPNDDLSCTDASGYLTLQMPCDGTVYVAFDRRASVLPDWMSGFGNTGDDISTSLSTQGYLNVFSRSYMTGVCTDFGCNHAPGSSDEYRSNYIVFYACGSIPVCGDGTLEGLEGCDDGNITPGDGCDQNCIAEVCGNGILQSGEECDDGNTNPDDDCDENCQLTGIEEHIYIMLLHFSRWDKPNLIATLQDVGAQQIDENTWNYTNSVSGKNFVIHNAQDFETMKQCLYTEGRHCIFKGHSNYGIGGVFIPDYDYAQEEVLDNILYIDDDLIFNYSGPTIAVPIKSMANPEKWPNWWPIDSNGISGIMPYDFGDPRGDPPYNYYHTYQVEGDPTHYKIETVRNTARERFPDSEVPAWYSPDGALPDSTNPDHLQHYITNPDLSYVWDKVCGPTGNLECPQPHYAKKTIIFPIEFDIDIEKLKYKRILLDMCQTFTYYLDTFHRGLTFGTALSSNGGGTYLYLKAYLEGKSDHEIWEIMQAHQAVYEYYDFSKRPFPFDEQ